MIDLSATENSSVDTTRVTLREITNCLRAIGAVALGIAALSREIREWRRDLTARRPQRNGKTLREGSRADHA